MRYTGPKDRLSRREGFDLFGKGAKLTRLNVTPGVHGPKGSRSAPSQFGRQLREKQKVKRMYGLTEKQFVRYVEKALKTKGNSVDVLFGHLERRLDNVVYRLNLVKSRPQARQLVSHRHVLVNGKKVNIPSYQVETGDIITLSEKSIKVPNVESLLKDSEASIPSWLARDHGAGSVLRVPGKEDVKEAINEQDIIEFYSR